ncbi:hypothetical protein [Apilactobacillus sp. EABW-1NA]|uniref:hypothetical protein n=1 Tax=Apilactobacillus sp. EABW-1NA TaxID=2984137 RepID=UPI0025B220E7|nr:hypothetical protein [Apilactobacillus sp. EABW-1NA]MDN2613292.1 hypothetical protein [Apilactobacillus sp. EABW-1NA]
MIKNLFRRIRTENLIFFIAMLIISLALLFVLPGILTRCVFISGIMILLVSLLFVKKREDYIDDFKNLNNSAKEVLISKSLNDASSNIFIELITGAGFVLAVYSSIFYRYHDVNIACILIAYFYWGFRMVQRTKALMYIDFINDKKKSLKSYQSSHKKFNRRRQR